MGGLEPALTMVCVLGVCLAMSVEQQNCRVSREPLGGESEAKESEKDSGGISRITRLDIAPAPVVSCSAVTDAHAKSK